MPSIADAVSFSSHGVIPVVVQDYDTGEVLLLGHMNSEALAKTVETGLTHLYSRHEAGELKPYGEESGRVQHVKSIRLGEDSSAVLIQVTQSFPSDAPRPLSTFNRRWHPESQSWVEEGEGGFVPPVAESD